MAQTTCAICGRGTVTHFVRVNNIRVTDAKEVGVGNPAEETFCHPDAHLMAKRRETVKPGDEISVAPCQFKSLQNSWHFTCLG